MSWWWFPIEDDDAAVERQFQIQDFLHQVTDVLDACVPLYNWYVDSGGSELDPLGDYVVGTTNAQGIWAAIQARIEALVDVFYDYSSIANGEWFSAGSEDGPRAQPGYMNYNVYKKFKTLARAVDDDVIPTAHLLRQEDVAATGISHTISGSYQFADDIAGFKWDSVEVTGLTKTYYEHFDGSGNLDTGYYTIRATGERSQDGYIYFASGNNSLSVTINYNVDTTGFGWTRRIGAGAGYAYADGSAQNGDVIHACLLNQIYACTVVLQDFAVLVSDGHSKVAGTAISSGSLKEWSTWMDDDGTMSTIYYQGDEDAQEACEIAKDGAEPGYDPPTDPDVDWYISAGWKTSNPWVPGPAYEYTGCAAEAGWVGSESPHTWTASINRFSLDLEDVPVSDPLANVKDFVGVAGPYAGSTTNGTYVSGVIPFIHAYVNNGEYYQSHEVTVDNPGVEDYTLPRHGEGDSPLTVTDDGGDDIVGCVWEPVDGSTGSCDPDTESCFMNARGASYSATGWVCIQLNTPNPTSSPP